MVLILPKFYDKMESMASIFLQKIAETLGYVIILSTLTESAVLMLLVTFEIIHSLFILSLCVLYDQRTTIKKVNVYLPACVMFSAFSIFSVSLNL